MANLLVIPARGGSKRIPKKNIKNFSGKPIISYSIEAAIKSGLFDEIMVSTDDDEIAEIAKTYGASVPFFRSKKNADDFATTFDVIQEVVSEYKLLNKQFEFICCLYPCAPLTTSKKLEEAFQLLKSEKFDSVLPIMQFSFPIQRALKIDGDNKTKFFYPQYSLTRSQDLEQGYHDAGQFYWMNTLKCIEKSAILTDITGSIIISEMEAQDIDTEMDWKLAELKYELLQSLK
ncbi:pseudaminic acid cytidylyltransferase [Patiriisocius sp. Uisw_017]|jgi:N-acylneuraminate cytidylyltransferase|uniref:pseudaminic acid cytidylyltransferase n=1 Tax=Patiriisocius sp. Uisw_017 TaxID=3230968 RepID=UPI0039E7DBD0